MDSSLDYTKAYKELKKIVEELSARDVEVDKLLSKLKRAAELAKICKKKLSEVESESKELIEKTLNEITSK